MKFLIFLLLFGRMARADEWEDFLSEKESCIEKPIDDYEEESENIIIDDIYINRLEGIEVIIDPYI